MRRMMADNHINGIINSGQKIKDLKLLNKRLSVRFLSKVNKFSSNKIKE